MKYAPLLVLVLSTLGVLPAERRPVPKGLLMETRGGAERVERAGPRPVRWGSPRDAAARRADDLWGASGTAAEGTPSVLALTHTGLTLVPGWRERDAAGVERTDYLLPPRASWQVSPLHAEEGARD